MSLPSVHIQQFAKTPVPGKVKTRLIPVLSPEQASIVHQNLLTHVAEVIAALGDEPYADIRHEIWSSAGGSFIDVLASRLHSSHHLQVGEDLGQRLAFATEARLRCADAVIVVGSDCPYIDASYYGNAIAGLFERGNDVVIGPALDGGYVLLATRRYYGGLFDNIAWGSGKVLDQTLAAAKTLQLKVDLLPSLSDVDRPEDFSALKASEQYEHLTEGV